MSHLDPQVLEQLAHDLGDTAFAVRFVTTYQAMLPGRVQRVLAALGPEDHEVDQVDLMDALLSLRTSAQAVGASALAALAGEIEEHVRLTDAPAARCVVRRLPELAEHTGRALDRLRACAETLAGSLSQPTGCSGPSLNPA